MSRITAALFGATALVALSSAPALAQSPFDGGYVGAALGYAWMKPNGTTTFSNATTQKVDRTNDGVTGAVFLGYGKTIDTLYLGIEGEIGISDQEKTSTLAGNSYNFDAGTSLGIALRAGLLATPDTLVYGRIGWQRTDLDVSGRLGSVAGTPTMDENEHLNGWRIGGGVEHALTENVLARLEYNYTDYESYKVSYGQGGARTNAEPHESAVRVGVAYRF
ncbi:outer membrane protein [Rhodocista pekingensis]|uniref:Outer membrane protein n=1 Tax=Rhodocista pekingensis TaxID=201185 RepID=A0ABW2KXX0_9PROT